MRERHDPLVVAFRLSILPGARGGSVWRHRLPGGRFRPGTSHQDVQPDPGRLHPRCRRRPAEPRVPPNIRRSCRSCDAPGIPSTDRRTSCRIRPDLPDQTERIGDPIRQDDSRRGTRSFNPLVPTAPTPLCWQVSAHRDDVLSRGSLRQTGPPRPDATGANGRRQSRLRQRAWFSRAVAQG